MFLTFATMLAALTMGYNASAFGQTANLQGMRSSVLTDSQQLNGYDFHAPFSATTASVVQKVFPDLIPGYLPSSLACHLAASPTVSTKTCRLTLHSSP